MCATAKCNFSFVKFRKLYYDFLFAIKVIIVNFIPRIFEPGNNHWEPWAICYIKGTLMQIWKSANIFVFIWKQYVEDLAIKHLLPFEICTCEICGNFVYKHSETIEYVKN